ACCLFERKHGSSIWTTIHTGTRRSSRSRIFLARCSSKSGSSTTIRTIPSSRSSAPIFRCLMENRSFSKRCGKCRQRTMEIAVIPYSAEFDHDGRKYQVHVPDLSIPKCTNCGELSFDREADHRLEAEFRKQLGLLTPEEIRTNRLD